MITAADVANRARKLVFDPIRLFVTIVIAAAIKNRFLSFLLVLVELIKAYIETGNKSIKIAVMSLPAK